jgi:Uma2 family endonuclease
MTTDTRLLTGEDFLLLPLDEPAELVEGRVVRMGRPTPRHGGIQAFMTVRLGQFGEETGRGRVLTDFGLFTRRDPDTVRGPDLGFLSYARWPGPLPESYLTIPPELVVEIVSPSNSWDDLLTKVHEYLALGVEQVWVVSPALRTVAVFRQGRGMVELGAEETLSGEGILDGFSLALADLFAR